MLLGHDLLHHWGAMHDMRTDTLLVDEERIQLNTKFKEDQPVIARVMARNKIVVPPNSVVRIPGQLDVQLRSDYCIEPVNDMYLEVPRTLRKKETEPVLCLVNPSNRYHTIKKGNILTTAVEIEGLIVNEVQTIQTPDNGKTIPKHLQKLFDDSTKHLDLNQQVKLKTLLCEYQDVFAKYEFDLGSFTAIEHTIDTGDAKPFKHRMRRTPACFVGEEEAHLKKMIDAGVIRESNSAWCSAPILIRKRDGSVRYCVDFRALNDVTVKDTFPLPLVKVCLDTLSGNSWFSKLDANSAYWQVGIKEEDRSKTAFCTKYGLFEHVRMGFGLTNFPACFSRVMNLILRGLTWKTILAFLNEILVLGKYLRRPS